VRPSTTRPRNTCSIELSAQRSSISSSLLRWIWRPRWDVRGMSNRVAAQLLLLIFTVTVSAVQTRTVPARTIPVPTTVSPEMQERSAAFGGEILTRLRKPASNGRRCGGEALCRQTRPQGAAYFSDLWGFVGISAHCAAFRDPRSLAEQYRARIKSCCNLAWMPGCLSLKLSRTDSTWKTIRLSARLHLAKSRTFSTRIFRGSSCIPHNEGTVS